MPANAEEDAVILADYQTDAKDPQELTNIQGFESRWIYASGWSSDTFTLQYRPSKSRSWQDVKSGLASGITAMNHAPVGQYRINRSGENDQATVMLI